MKSIYFKNFLMTAAMVLTSFLIIGVAFVFIGRSFVINTHRENMENSATLITHTALSLCPDGDYSGLELRMTLSTTSRMTGNTIFITDLGGLIVNCSDDPHSCGHIGKRLSASTLYSLHSAGKLDAVSNLDGLYGGTRYVYAMPIAYRSTDAALGYVFVSTDSTTIISAWESFVWVFFAVTMAVTMLALILSLVTSKRMAQPLDEMAAAARRFAHGDFSVRVPNEDDTVEVAALTDAFNNMADSLERSEELRNEFIANISHELKTPMTTIAGFADGILDGTIPKSEEDKYLAVIADETRRLSRLVRHMLELSRMKSQGADLARRRDFDLNELMIRTLLSFEVRAEEKRLGMDLQLPEDHMRVNADPDAITQVLYNLLDNAIKFAEPDSDITLSLWKEEGRAYVSVRNRGETIPPDDLPLIFDRFHKSDRSRSLDRDGAGLGLYLVKSILDSHDEDIAVTSREGVTEFVFTLRLAEPERRQDKKQDKKQEKKPERRGLRLTRRSGSKKQTEEAESAEK